MARLHRSAVHGVRILAISPHVPYEGIPHAGGAYLLRHLDELRRHHEVALLVAGFAEAQRASALAPAWLDLDLAPVDVGRADLAQQRDRIRRRLRYRALHASALRALRRRGLYERAASADLVELHWTDAAILVPELRRRGCAAPIVVFAYDLNAEAAPSLRRLLPPARAASARLLEPIRRRMDARDLDGADLVVVFKDADVDLLGSLGVRTPVLVSPPWLDVPDPPPGPANNSSVLFTGAMWRVENEDGVRWFLEHVWPRVREAIPDATFTIAGAGPSAVLESSAAASPGVTVTGAVDDLAPCYRDAAVFVAPLFVAGGLKFKVVQAMAYGLPVVSSTIGAAGIVDRAPAGALWAVTDEPRAMVEAVVDALRDHAAAAGRGRVAAAWCREALSFDSWTERLLATYNTLAAPPTTMER